jgi:hypothetical protein
LYYEKAFENLRLAEKHEEDVRNYYPEMGEYVNKMEGEGACDFFNTTFAESCRTDWNAFIQIGVDTCITGILKFSYDLENIILYREYGNELFADDIVSNFSNKFIPFCFIFL